MIRYRRRASHPAWDLYLKYIESLHGTNDGANADFRAWIERQGGNLEIENDFSPAAVNVITFEDPKDELAFKLKLGI
jgi:hypothetical protein